MSLIPKNVHSSWNKFLTTEIFDELDEIEKKIGMNTNPEHNNILRFMLCNLNNVKVVILGQDPYPEKGRPTGRAFEVGDLQAPEHGLHRGRQVAIFEDELEQHGHQVNGVVIHFAHDTGAL